MNRKLSYTQKASLVMQKHFTILGRLMTFEQDGITCLTETSDDAKQLEDIQYMLTDETKTDIYPDPNSYDKLYFKIRSDRDYLLRNFLLGHLYKITFKIQIIPGNGCSDTAFFVPIVIQQADIL